MEEIKFYKLDKSKKYSAEGVHLKKGSFALFCGVILFFWAIAIALFILNAGKLFRDAQLTVFTFGFTAIVCVITVCLCFKLRPIIKKVMRVRRVLKNCTLTDGTVTEVSVCGIKQTGSETVSKYAYKTVALRYTFYGRDGTLRGGEFAVNYNVNPFSEGQKLMIAFNDDDSVVLREYALVGDGKNETPA